MKFTTLCANLRGKLTPLKLLTGVLVIILLLGMVTSILSFITTGVQGEMFQQQFCLRDECLGALFKNSANAISLANATFTLLTAITTIGGIIVALMTYLATVSSSILTNHIAHFAIFKDCVDGEIKKRSSVNESSVDILSWYNSVFPRSRVGEITVSNSYVSWVNELNRIIGNSNSKMTSPADGSFRYTDHQTKITKHLAKIGIALDRYPRNDFLK